MNDRIEAGTFCVAACLNGGNLKIKKLRAKNYQYRDKFT